MMTPLDIAELKMMETYEAIAELTSQVSGDKYGLTFELRQSRAAELSALTEAYYFWEERCKDPRRPR